MGGKSSKPEDINWEISQDFGYKLDDNIMTIKCEDSYIHLLKKFILAIKYLNEIYIIEQGVLRCGDDLVFNEKNLVSFLNSNKSDFDFIGTAASILSAPVFLKHAIATAKAPTAFLGCLRTCSPSQSGC